MPIHYSSPVRQRLLYSSSHSPNGNRITARTALNLTMLAVTAALCGPACASDTPGELPACATLPAATLQHMLTQVNACQKDASFLATLGQLLNTQGRYLDAADHLERALMLEPGLKDAQLSYAIALTGNGDLLSATELLDNLLADPTLPRSLRPLITQQKANIAAIANTGSWQSRFTLTTRLGYDSNLLGAPNLSSLALTLAGQTQVLDLEDSYLARASSYVRADAQLNLQHIQLDGTRWDAVASLRTRQSPGVENADSTQIDLLLERNSQLGTAASGGGAYGNYLNLSASDLRSDASAYYQAWGIAGGWAGAWSAVNVNSIAPCQARLGAEWQMRSYIENTVLSGRYAGISANWSCTPATGMQWLLGLKAGQDIAANAARAGGNQNQYSLRLASYLPLGNTRRSGLLLDYDQSHQTDTSGYSPIIDNGRIRSIARQALRLEYQYTLTPGTQWLLGAERVAQTSSLAIFQMDNWGAYTGLRFNW